MPRPGMPSAAGSKTKIVLVRQPVKSVRASDHPDRLPVQLAIGVIATVGALAVLWLLGSLGFRLGFAPMMRVPDLLLEGADGLAAGVLMLISMPLTILEAGIVEPMWLMIGFALIAIPAGVLGAAKPGAPGGPRPKPAIVALGITGAVAAMLNAALVIWWSASPIRGALVRELPTSAAAVQEWLGDLQLGAGMDVLAAIAASLWVVVVMRLALPPWLRGLAASASFFGLAIILAAMAMSNVAVSQLVTGRSVSVMDEAGSPPQLILGHTRRSMAAVRVDDGRALVELRDRPAVLTVIGQESVAGFLIGRAPVEE